MGYDASTGIFTVPVGGIYVFDWSILAWEGLSHTALTINGQFKSWNHCNSGKSKHWERIDKRSRSLWDQKSQRLCIKFNITDEQTCYAPVSAHILKHITKQSMKIAQYWWHVFCCRSNKYMYVCMILCENVTSICENIYENTCQDSNIMEGNDVRVYILKTRPVTYL